MYKNRQSDELLLPAAGRRNADLFVELYLATYANDTTRTH